MKPVKRERVCSVVIMCIAAVVSVTAGSVLGLYCWKYDNLYVVLFTSEWVF